jgi:hypothetical protein
MPALLHGLESLVKETAGVQSAEFQTTQAVVASILSGEPSDETHHRFPSVGTRREQMDIVYQITNDPPQGGLAGMYGDVQTDERVRLTAERWDQLTAL